MGVIVAFSDSGRNATTLTLLAFLLRLKPDSSGQDFEEGFDEVVGALDVAEVEVEKNCVTQGVWKTVWSLEVVNQMVVAPVLGY